MGDFNERALKRSRQELLELRGQVTALLNDWYPFLDGEGIISEYVRLLNTTNPNIHKTRSDIHVDLGILKDLLPKLEHEHAEAKKEFFNAQLSNIYTYRKRSMVLHELHGLLLKKISDDLRRWIKQLLVADDEWTDILAFSVEREEELMRQASSKGVLLTKQTIDPEQFKEYIIGFSADIRKEEEILRACSDIPQMCQSVENLLPFLEEKCFSMYNEKPSSITVSSVHCQKWFLPRVDILAVRLTWRGRG
ncbi:uncharacterized protein LOC113331209 isoform X2 [Papaver somniferum]|uniref:uncharacterized protein LOC113331209 isoform X2 n=1 Tax=Papaver somniferum TaxID=3469 RepID=UPI000E6F7760|nr:uncharacterized protein LOC113331209 isoform X2 [Papaver somniferum]